MHIDDVKPTIDQVAREAVRQGQETVTIPIEHWALISLMISDTAGSRRRIQELLETINREVGRRRAAERVAADAQAVAREARELAEAALARAAG